MASELIWPASISFEVNCGTPSFCLPRIGEFLGVETPPHIWYQKCCEIGGRKFSLEQVTCFSLSFGFLFYPISMLFNFRRSRIKSKLFPVSYENFKLGLSLFSPLLVFFFCCGLLPPPWATPPALTVRDFLRLPKQVLSATILWLPLFSLQGSLPVTTARLSHTPPPTM